MRSAASSRGSPALALTGLVSTTDAPQSTEYTLSAIAAVAARWHLVAGGAAD